VTPRGDGRRWENQRMLSSFTRVSVHYDEALRLADDEAVD